VGLFDRIRKALEFEPEPVEATSSDQVPADWLHSGAWRRWPVPTGEVRGEASYESELRGLVGRRRKRGYLVPFVAELLREDWHEDHPNAIRVEINDNIVGHLAHELADLVAPEMDGLQYRKIAVPAIVRGGFSAHEERPATSYSVWLWLDRTIDPPELKLPDLPAHDPYWWPPDVPDGRDGCPECGMRKYMREPQPGQLECADCGHKWRE